MKTGMNAILTHVTTFAGVQMSFSPAMRYAPSSTISPTSS